MMTQELMRRWEAMRGRVVAHYRSRGWDEEDAQDLFGEALLKAVERRDGLDESEAAEAWFWQLATRMAVDEARRIERRPMKRADLDLSRMPADELEEETCRCSLSLLEELPTSYHDILESVILGGQAVKDYAKEASISANNASVRLYRARRALRDKLSDVCQTTTVSECLDCGCSA